MRGRGNAVVIYRDPSAINSNSSNNGSVDYGIGNNSVVTTNDPSATTFNDTSNNGFVGTFNGGRDNSVVTINDPSTTNPNDNSNDGAVDTSTRGNDVVNINDPSTSSAYNNNCCTSNSERIDCTIRTSDNRNASIANSNAFHTMAGIHQNSENVVAPEDSYCVQGLFAHDYLTIAINSSGDDIAHAVEIMKREQSANHQEVEKAASILAQPNYAQHVTQYCNMIRRPVECTVGIVGENGTMQRMFAHTVFGEFRHLALTDVAKAYEKKLYSSTDKCIDSVRRLLCYAKSLIATIGEDAYKSRWLSLDPEAIVLGAQETPRVTEPDRRDLSSKRASAEHSTLPAEHDTTNAAFRQTGLPTKRDRHAEVVQWYLEELPKHGRVYAESLLEKFIQKEYGKKHRHMYPGTNVLGFKMETKGDHYRAVLQFSIEKAVAGNNGDHTYKMWTDWKQGAVLSKQETKSIKRNLSAEVLAYFRVDPLWFGGRAYEGTAMTWPSEFHKTNCKNVDDSSRQDANT